MKVKRLVIALYLSVSVFAWAADKTPVTDDVINDRVKVKLATDTVVKGGGLGIDVKQGVVTLTGKVETEKQKQKAEKLAKKIAGVKGVTNQIQVAHK
jgi:hyperosmotically inducible periplasmic protein